VFRFTGAADIAESWLKGDIGANLLLLRKVLQDTDQWMEKFQS
jgi:hypothetical protein